MPLFRCPDCQRKGIIPLAFCEDWFFRAERDEESHAMLARCADCEAGRAAEEPVRWNPIEPE